MDYAPYGWTPEAMAAFRDYIEKGQGGWVGFHHATLLGEFDGYPMWDWFSDFMGGIRYENDIASFASANVHVEQGAHPCMRGIPSGFLVTREEWYTYNRSPPADWPGPYAIFSAMRLHPPMPPPDREPIIRA